MYFVFEVGFSLLFVVFKNTIFLKTFLILVCKYTITNLINITIALFIVSSLISPYFLLWQILLTSLLHYLCIALWLLIAS